MGDNSTIEWTSSEDGTPGATWNCVLGCTKCTEGCAGCYAINTVARGLSIQHRGLTVYGDDGLDWTGEVRLVPHLFDYPSRHPKGRKIFVNSLSDWFVPEVLQLPELTSDGIECFRCEEDGKVPHRKTGERRVCPSCNGSKVHPLDIKMKRSPLAHLVTEMVANPQHTFQVLTKRPQIMARVLGLPMFRLEVNACLMERGLAVMPGGMSEPDFAWPRHIWWGTSIEFDKYAFRADHLRRINGVRFISAEPLLGPLPSLNLEGIDWLIVGGESGAKARPMDPDWVRELRDLTKLQGKGVCGTCGGSGSVDVPGGGAACPRCYIESLGCGPGREPTAFFFKQWGEWGPDGRGCTIPGRDYVGADGNRSVLVGPEDHNGMRQEMTRFGKKVTGRALDGHTYSEFPGA